MDTQANQPLCGTVLGGLELAPQVRAGPRCQGAPAMLALCTWVLILVGKRTGLLLRLIRQEEARIGEA